MTGKRSLVIFKEEIARLNPEQQREMLADLIFENDVLELALHTAQITAKLEMLVISQIKFNLRLLGIIEKLP